jgi:hypothetical protein
MNVTDGHLRPVRRLLLFPDATCSESVAEYQCAPGGGGPSVSPALPSSPIAVELLIVPLAVGIGWLEFGRFVALRSTP